MIEFVHYTLQTRVKIKCSKHLIGTKIGKIWIHKFFTPPPRVGQMSYPDVPEIFVLLLLIFRAAGVPVPQQYTLFLVLSFVYVLSIALMDYYNHCIDAVIISDNVLGFQFTMVYLR